VKGDLDQVSFQPRGAAWRDSGAQRSGRKRDGKRKRQREREKERERKGGREQEWRKGDGDTHVARACVFTNTRGHVHPARVRRVSMCTLVHIAQVGCARCIGASHGGREMERRSRNRELRQAARANIQTAPATDDSLVASVKVKASLTLMGNYFAGLSRLPRRVPCTWLPRSTFSRAFNRLRSANHAPHGPLTRKRT